MEITEKMLDDFGLAALPLMLWLRKNCQPHVAAVVDSEKAELCEELAMIGLLDALTEVKYDGG